MTVRKIGRPRIKHWPHERSVRFNDVQRERLERAADQLEMPVAAVVRELVDEEMHGVLPQSCPPYKFDETDDKDQIIFEANHPGEREIKITPVQGYGEILRALSLLDTTYTPGGKRLAGMKVRLNNSVHTIEDNTRKTVTVDDALPPIDIEYRITKSDEAAVSYVFLD